VVFDADLYSSTKLVLDYLGDTIVPGSYLYFDDFSHRNDEMRAFDEFIHTRAPVLSRRSHAGTVGGDVSNGRLDLQASWFGIFPPFLDAPHRSLAKHSVLHRELCAGRVVGARRCSRNRNLRRIWLREEGSADQIHRDLCNNGNATSWIRLRIRPIPTISSPPRCSILGINGNRKVASKRVAGRFKIMRISPGP